MGNSSTRVYLTSRITNRCDHVGIFYCCVVYHIQGMDVDRYVPVKPLLACFLKCLVHSMAMNKIGIL